MALAVFDVDGTLVKGPTTEKRLIALLLRSGRIRTGQLLAFLRFAIDRAPEFGRHVMKKNKAYLEGLKCGDVEGLTADWVRRSAPGWWFAPCLARLRQHQAVGDTVVLLSGTPQFLADALARELGVNRAIGTRCASEAGRFVAGSPVRHPFGKEKLELIEALCAEYGVPATKVLIYADSVHDLPMLRFAGHPVAVRPDTGLRTAATAEGWEILGRR